MRGTAGSVYTVTQVNAYIKNMFSQDYLLGHVFVKGEVSNCKYHNSGHIYFTLKDENAAISCIMFASNRRGLEFHLENGQKVIAAGSVGVYEKGGSYQLYALQIRRDGLGELYLKYEALKRELEEMGMFDPRYKKPVPAFVRTLGVVTAPTGAAVRDIIQISRRRNPGIRIILYAAKVQGEGAAQSIAEGIHALEARKPDVIIIGRGGGSIEDLWAFNEEIVARAVFSCSIPVISAVGHETDTVISDFVADLRAPTPSAAAELAVADVNQMLMRLEQEEERLGILMHRRLEGYRKELQRYELTLRLLGPVNSVNNMKSALGEKRKLLLSTMERLLLMRKNEAALYRERLAGLSPREKLRAGYAVVLKPGKEKPERVQRSGQLAPGEDIEIWFSDGKAQAKVMDVQEES